MNILLKKLTNKDFSCTITFSKTLIRVKVEQIQ